MVNSTFHTTFCNRHQRFCDSEQHVISWIHWIWIHHGWCSWSRRLQQDGADEACAESVVRWKNNIRDAWCEAECESGRWFQCRERGERLCKMKKSRRTCEAELAIFFWHANPPHPRLGHSMLRSFCRMQNLKYISIMKMWSTEC